MKSSRTLVALVLAGVAMSQTSVSPDSFATSTFDIVIVGGGTAGLVLANRLSAQNLRVGVIEAGSYNDTGDPVIDIPYGASIYLQNPNAFAWGNPKYDWEFVSVPQPALGGRPIHYPRGKVLGGSSAINEMAWLRGNKLDYDAWSSVFGNDGWDFDSLLPYFERVENWTSPIHSAPLVPGTTKGDFDSLASVQGTDGLVQTRYNTYLVPLDTVVTQTSANLGFPLNPNPDGGYNAYEPLAGVDSSVDISTGKRSYAVSAYYNATVRARKNLSVLTGALATRIIWDNLTQGNGALTAKGVEYVVGGKSYVANATKEVILSAGSLKTPQILELSGVGNATILKNAGVPVLVDFPEIGENLQDQPLVQTDYFVNDGVLTLDSLMWNQTYFNEQKALYDASHTGAFSWTPSVTGAWPLQNVTSMANYTSLRNNVNSALSNMELTPLQAAQYKFTLQLVDSGIPYVDFIWMSRGGIASTAQPNKGHGTMIAWLLYELSRGSVHINSSDPTAPPVIDPKYMSMEWDVSVLTAATEYFNQMTTVQPLASQLQSRNTPNSTVQTTSQWTQFVLDTVTTVDHPIGTTPMAAKNLGGVVDSRLRVYGLENVRIVDAGVLPMTFGGTPQQTVYAIAEKASDLILEDLQY